MATTTHKSSFYGRILGDALRITWQHKHLWLLGFFAVFTRYGNPIDSLYTVFNAVFRGSWTIDLSQKLANYIPGFDTLVSIIKFSPNPILTSIFFSAIVLIIFFVLIVIAIIGTGGLIGSVRKVELGSDTTLKDSLKLGIGNFKHTFGIMLGSIIIQTIFLTIASIARKLIGFPSNIFIWILLAIVFILVGLASITINLLMIYALNESIARKKRIMDSVIVAWNLLKKHWLISLEMSVLSLFVSLGMTLAIFLGLLVLSVPIIFIGMVLLVLGATGWFSVIIYLTLIAVFICAIILLATVGTFIGSVWSLLWSEFENGQPVSRIESLILKRKK